MSSGRRRSSAAESASASQAPSSPPPSNCSRPFRNSVIAHPHEYNGARVLPPTSPDMTKSESGEQLFQLYQPILNSPMGQELSSASGSSSSSHPYAAPAASASLRAATSNGTAPGALGNGIHGLPPTIDEVSLVPQRSAPLPPGVQRPSTAGQQASSSSSSGAVSPTSTLGYSSAKPPSANRSSYIAGSYKSYQTPLSAASTTSGTSGIHAQPSSGPLQNQSYAGLPSSSAASSAGPSALQPPYPQRSYTTDGDAFQSLNALGGPNRSQGNGTLASGVQSMNLTSPALSSNGGTFSDVSPAVSNSSNGPAAATMQGQSSRSRDSGGPGRTTLKSVFGGFVNSMSGK